MRFCNLLLHCLVASTAHAAAPTVSSLLARTRVLSAAWQLSPGEKEGSYAFESTFEKADGECRSWSNWLIQSRLMLGQYPHAQPAPGGPTSKEAREHLKLCIAAGVTAFSCLQDELPPQDATDSWPADGVCLSDGESRDRWPEPFVRYKPDADAAAEKLEVAAPAYFHCGIVDLSIPTSLPSLLSILDEMIAHYETGGQAIYVHCWGGRGRAGLVGACLLSLLRPELDSEAVLSLVQAAYDSRAGASAMPGQLKRSPQTEAQRRYVTSFVSSVRAARRYESDVAMAEEGGMPRGYL